MALKRFFTFVLCLALVFGVMPKAKAQEKMVTEMEMTTLAETTFAKCLTSSGRTTFDGYCGAYVSHQLYNLGINRWLSSRDGRDQYDYYAGIRKTSGGYYTRPYSVAEFGMLDALKHITENGTKDVYNILVGFQWTNTVAGGKYGHVVLIYGIVDGVVYFSESYPIYIDGPHLEGQLVKCSMERFAKYYGSWTEYEGLVVFGNREYIDSCEITGTNLVVQARFESYIRSQPCLVGENKCVKVRTVMPGERLHVTGIYKNLQGQQFYGLFGGGFIAASAVGEVRANPEELALENFDIPQQLELGASGQIAGFVQADFAQVGVVELRISDLQGNMVMMQQMLCQGRTGDLAELNKDLQLSSLQEGVYSVEIFVDAACPTARGATVYGRTCLGGGYIQVGGAELPEELPELKSYTVHNGEGWTYEGGWRMYQNGQPITGWLDDCGARYYLDETGRTVEGWKAVDGGLYYFSDTGALVKNSQVSLEGVTYEIDGQGNAQIVKK